MNDERVMPHDLDAEAAVLSAMMLDHAALDVALNIVQPEHFYAEAHRRICEAAEALSRASEPVDVVTVASWLRDRNRLTQVGGSAYIAQIADCVPAIVNVEAYANTVRDRWRIRELIKAAQRIAADGFGPIDNAQEFIDGAGQAVYRIAQSGEQRDVVPIDQVLRKSHRRMIDAEARGQNNVELSTGITELDAMIGGLNRGRLTVVAARPGMGKTSLAMGFAETVAMDGGTALIFSLEMPGEQLGMRMACARAGASVFQGLNGWLPVHDRTNVLAAMDDLRSLPIWIDDTPGLSLMRIRAKARMAVARAGRPLSIVVIDYLQLMSSMPTEGRRSTRDQEIGEISRGLKTLAKELECAVVLVSQLNRTVEEEKDKRPRLHHLRESGAIEQDADDVIFIYRQSYYQARSEDDKRKEPRDIAEIIVAKQRNGGTGKVEVEWIPTSAAFDNLHSTA